MRLIDEITSFMEGCGLECSRRMRDGIEVIVTKIPYRTETRTILPLEISSHSIHDAVQLSERMHQCIESIRLDCGHPVIITEDRWHSQQEMTKARLLAHIEVFDHIYARNCEVRKIDKSTASEFLKVSHSYGDAACRYRYGLYLKRHTGHIAAGGAETARHPSGTLVAVATFSNARKWIKGDKTIRSYEWTRYASLPGVRISGGMGRLLKAFINEAAPDDIMSYADLEWSEGEVYERLGFALEGLKSPVVFEVDPSCWFRHPIQDKGSNQKEQNSRMLYFCNFGSNKYRLKLTDYE